MNLNPKLFEKDVEMVLTRNRYGEGAVGAGEEESEGGGADGKPPDREAAEKALWPLRSLGGKIIGGYE